MTTRPNDMEPGGRLYRVRVLVPMQERHNGAIEAALPLGIILALMYAIGITVRYRVPHAKDVPFEAVLLVAIPFCVAAVAFLAWVKWMDRKRARLGEEHRRLVEKFGTREVQWSPGGWHG